MNWLGQCGSEAGTGSNLNCQFSRLKELVRTGSQMIRNDIHINFVKSDAA
jgi:hypothetical protein